MIIAAQLKELETLQQETLDRLDSIEKRLEKGLAGINDVDAAELVRIQPLCSKLKEILNPSKNYSIKGMLSPAMRWVKLFWHSDIFFIKPTMAIFGCCLALGFIGTGGQLLQEAPFMTIAGIVLVGIGWRQLVRTLKKVDDAKGRRLAVNGISTKVFMAAVQQREDWYVISKSRGEAAELTTCTFNVLDIHEGTVILDVFAGPNRQFAGVVHSNGNFYPQGQFNYPIATAMPDALQALFSKIQALQGLVEEQWEAKMLLQKVDENQQALLALDEVWRAIHIPEEVKTRLLQMLDLFRCGDPAAPRGLLLFGPPGTGKTLVAKAIADSCNIAFFSTSLPDFKMGHIGQSAQKVKSFWNDVRKEGRAIIFIDECEGVFGSRGGVDSDSFTAEIVQTFLAEWDGLNTKGKATDIWVIGATNRRELIDAAILSRFGQEVEIPLPDGAMRRSILEAELEVINLPTKWLPENTDKLTQGLSGRDINRLATAIRMAMLGADAPTPEHLKAALAQMRQRGATATDEDARWDTLVLDERTMKELKTVCGMLNHADALRKQGVAIPRGIIFHGRREPGRRRLPGHWPTSRD